MTEPYRMTRRCPYCLGRGCGDCANTGQLHVVCHRPLRDDIEPLDPVEVCECPADHLWVLERKKLK